MVKSFVLVVFFFTLNLIIIDRSYAWGERGHDVICQVATQLVKKPALVALFKTKAGLVGHICNVPDIDWKKSNLNQDSSHYIQLDGVGKSLATAPISILDFFQMAGATRALSAEKDLTKKVGTLWWRVNQFYELGKESLAELSEHQVMGVNDDTSLTRAVIYFGLMGHFVGDASVPFHNTSDHDGYGNGEGGIHSYFETQSVNHIQTDLIADVKKKADEMGRIEEAFYSSQPVPELVKMMSIQALSLVPLVSSLDPVLDPSSQSLFQGKTYFQKARRAEPSAGATAFKEIIVGQLARSAILLAALWDKAYGDLGSTTVNLTGEVKVLGDPIYYAPNYF